MLRLENLTIEHENNPLGIDVESPRFGWVLWSDESDTFQTAYRIEISSVDTLICDSGKINSKKSIEVVISEFMPVAKTRYELSITVWDNHNSVANIEGHFEMGFMKTKWQSSWIEPVQRPTLPTKDLDQPLTEFEIVTEYNPDRDFTEFQPAQYIRIPYKVDKAIKKARVYLTAHGIYEFTINGITVSDRMFAPDNTSYHKILQYQTYDVSEVLSQGDNVFGIVVADGWWSGRIGATGDSCQYGDKVGILVQGEIEYEDGSIDIIDGKEGKSATGPIVFSDIFVGEKYDARLEKTGWDTPDYDDSDWNPVLIVEYPMSNLVGQYGGGVETIMSFDPKEIINTPEGDIVIDVGQVLAGQLEITLSSEEGRMIRFDHSEVLDKEGNFFNNILGVNKEQVLYYITKEGKQTYRSKFTFHGFRYVRVIGWPGELSVEDVRVHALSSRMQNIGSFHTSNEKINQLQSNIWWSQVSNTLSIPTDCPQRERAGWTGDIMVFAPTMNFNRQSNSFLTRWLANVRADQLKDGAVPMVVPYMKAYKSVSSIFGSETSCGWGDAIIQVPLSMYRSYGDKAALQDNYDAMKRWVLYIQDRAANNHPDDYDKWDLEHQNRSQYLWNTDFHYGDWLVPSMVLGNPDGGAMVETAFKTKGIVAPAYYAFSVKSISEVASILGNEEDVKYYDDLYEKIKYAFIDEYIDEDGIMSTDLQGIYVIALKNGLYTESLKTKLIQRLVQLIHENDDRLDTGFLSIPYLMDMLCQHGERALAYTLLYQTKCPSWLYEVEQGATTMWESWGAIGEDGTVSTYSYNHYAFGCIGDWLYREIGGLKIVEAGYEVFEISPDFSCGLNHVKLSLYTPYGFAKVEWVRKENEVTIIVEIPANTNAIVKIPGNQKRRIGSGRYEFSSIVENEGKIMVN